MNRAKRARFGVNRQKTADPGFTRGALAAEDR
jgi:hypothetical protein